MKTELSLSERFFNYFVKQISPKVKDIFYTFDETYGGDVSFIYNYKKWKLHFTVCKYSDNICIISTDWYSTDLINVKNWRKECNKLQSYIQKHSKY